MKNLESILAENMRRFNTKNLSEQAAGAKAGGPVPAGAKAGGPVPAANPAPTDVVSRITKLDPEIPALLDAFDKEKAPVTGTSVIVRSTKNSILVFTSGKSETVIGTYRLDIFKISDKMPIPIPYSAAMLISRKLGGATWRNTDPSDFSISAGINLNSTYAIYKSAGKEIQDKFNTLWNSAAEWPGSLQAAQAELLAAATNYVIANADRFKLAFQSFTRTADSIQKYWNDNPVSTTQSQYIKFVVQPITGNAKKILDAVQDTELINVIKYKSNPSNWNNAGKYPALKIPAPIA
jgi:hypothetical protein